MTPIETIANHVKREAERLHFEHEHIADELQDLDEALRSIDFDSEPLPHLEGLVEAGAIVRSLESELPTHFVEEEGSLLQDLVRLDPELSGWAAAMAENHSCVWRELETIHVSLNHLSSSTELAEDVESLQDHVGKLRDLIKTHACSEEMVARFVRKIAAHAVA